MKVILFSDLHAHCWTEFSNVVDGIPDRLLDCISVIDAITSYATKHGIKHVIFGGDLTHVPGSLKTMVMQLLASALRRAKKAGIRVYAAPGNHDYQDRRGSYNTVKIFSECGLLTTSRRLLDLGAIELALFPYTDDEDMFKRRVDEFPTQRKILAVFHHGFKGARIGSDLEYVVRNPIGCSQIPKAWSAFSGHYHTHQTVDSLTYIGSPLEHTRSDRSDRKGFIVYDTATQNIKRVPLKSPRFVELSELALLGPMTEATGNFVDMIVSDTDVAEASTQIMAAGARGCFVTEKLPVKTDRKTVRKTRGSDRAILESYINERKADARLLDVGLALLAEESV